MFATEQEKSGSYYDMTARLVIYAPEALGRDSAKTALGVLRYASNPIVAVIDKNQVGKTIKEVCGIDSEAAIVAGIDEALALKPDALLLGTAWSGGALPEPWRPDLLKAINAGLDIINGLHDFLANDPELSAAAVKNNVRLLDVRKTPDQLPIGTGLAAKLDSFVLLTVGSDCSVGKMTTALELQKSAQKANKTAGFVATGQTGIMICGSGIAIDRVIGDFMAGAVEKMVVEQAPGNEYLFVEGQGSIVHPSFSGVTLSLMHGSCPQGLILCHNARRTQIHGLKSHDLLPLAELISIYENLCSYMRPAKVLGVAFNTYGMTESEALAAIEKAEQSLGIPVCDPVRQGADLLFEAVRVYKESLK